MRMIAAVALIGIAFIAIYSLRSNIDDGTRFAFMALLLVAGVCSLKILEPTRRRPFV